MKKAFIPFLGLVLFLAILTRWPARLEADESNGAPPRLTATSSNVLAELQQALSGTTSVLTDFIQVKQMAVMRQKVIIKGQLAFQQPNRFAWHVIEPIRYNLILQGTTLHQWDETTGQEQQLTMADNPIFAMVNRQLSAWFGGQFEDLLKDFDARIDPAVDRSVIFTPNQNSFARKAIKQIVLTFREDRRYLETIQIEELAGDQTLMTFTNTVLNSPIPSGVWEAKPHGR